MNWNKCRFTRNKEKKPLFFTLHFFPCVFSSVVLVRVIRKFCWPHSKFHFKNEHCMFQQISFQNQKLKESTQFAWNKKKNSQNDNHHALFTNSLENMLILGKNEWNSWSEKRISFVFFFCSVSALSILSSNDFFFKKKKKEEQTGLFLPCPAFPIIPAMDLFANCELCIRASSHHFYHKLSQRIAHKDADALNSSYGSAHDIG